MEVLEPILSRCAISIYIAALMLEATTVPIALYNLPHQAAVVYLAFQVSSAVAGSCKTLLQSLSPTTCCWAQILLLLLPLADPPPLWAQRLLRYSMSSYAKWSRLKVVFEDEQATFSDQSTPCVIGDLCLYSSPTVGACTFCCSSAYSRKESAYTL